MMANFVFIAVLKLELMLFKRAGTQWPASSTLPKEDPPIRPTLQANISCRHVKPTTTPFLSHWLPVPGGKQRGAVCLVHYPLLHFLLNIRSRDVGSHGQHRKSRRQIYIFHEKKEPLRHPRTFILSDPCYYKD